MAKDKKEPAVNVNVEKPAQKKLKYEVRVAEYHELQPSKVQSGVRIVLRSALNLGMCDDKRAVARTRHGTMQLTHNVNEDNAKSCTITGRLERTVSLPEKAGQAGEIRLSFTVSSKLPMAEVDKILGWKRNDTILDCEFVGGYDQMEIPGIGDGGEGDD